MYTQQSVKFNIWAGIFCDRWWGLYFLRCSFTGEIYFPYREILLTYYALVVRHYLSKFFSRNARRGSAITITTIKLIYFFCGYIKNYTSRIQPISLENSRRSIVDEWCSHLNITVPRFSTQIRQMPDVFLNVVVVTTQFCFRWDIL